MANGKRSDVIWFMDKYVFAIECVPFFKKGLRKCPENSKLGVVVVGKTVIVKYDDAMCGICWKVVSIVSMMDISAIDTTMSPGFFHIGGEKCEIGPNGCEINKT